MTDPPAAPLEQLQELEQLYELAPAGLCAVDRDLRYVRANAAYAEVVGRDVRDIIGRTMYEVVREPARGPAVAVAKQAIETGRSVLEAEIRSVQPADPTRPRIFLVNAHPVIRRGEVVGSAAVLQDVTSLRLAQEEALSRLRELESIYANSPVGLAFFDRNLRYLRVNQQLADMNGISIEEMVGKSYRDLSPETADTAIPFLEKLMDGGEPVRHLELSSRPPADRENDHHYLFSMDPVRDASDRVIGFVSAVQDVTERRETEDVAARRLEEIETLYASAPIGLCHMDTELRIVHLNPLFAQVSPLPLEDQVGRLAAEVLPEGIARQVLSDLAFVAKTGSPTGELEVRGTLPRSGGREYTWISRTHPIRSSEGEVTGIITVLQDASNMAERRRAVETVRDRLLEAQRVSRVGSWEWNLLADRVWWSQEMYEIFGEGPTFEPTFLGFFERVHADDRSQIRAQIDHTLANDEPVRITYRILRSDGSERLIFSGARLQRTSDGVAARMVGTCQDVTEQSARPRARSARG